MEMLRYNRPSFCALQPACCATCGTAGLEIYDNIDGWYFLKFMHMVSVGFLPFTVNKGPSHSLHGFFQDVMSTILQG